MEFSAANSEDSTSQRSVSLIAQLPRVLIILGATAGFAIIAAEYAKPFSYFGPRQIAALAGCVSMMLAGAAWEVRLGLRVLSDVVRFWALASFLTLLTAALYYFQIESRPFSQFVGPLTLFGFIINHNLPPSARKPLFVLLSIIVIVGVFGAASIPAALALVSVGLALIGVCHLPIPMWGRLAILAACGAGLAMLRAGCLTQDWIAIVLPIIASVFMYRLAVYLYDISHGKGPKDVWGRLGYFFMFPNMVLPFFPVVDFSTFGRTYYNAEALSIYRRGASYMLRGLIHLLLYRIVYMYFVLAPDQVHDPLSFLRYVVANFGLYLKISGLFHLAVGVLVIFGFNLPETHTRFYFANSFIDFWRRINIYWKDFMQKMVFTPSYMQFKKLGVSHLTGVSLSILVVFLATWALHAYQWFWITGTYLFRATDMLFWAILGLLLIGQTLLEARPKPSSSTTSGLLGPRVVLVVRTVCTFLFICLLWSFWTSPTVEDWLTLVGRSGLAPALLVSKSASLSEWLLTIMSAVMLVGLVAVAMGLTFGLARSSSPPLRAAVRKAAKPKPYYSGLALGAAAIVLIVGVQLSAVGALFGPQARHVAMSVGTGMLNRIDQAELTRGYYEDLAGEGNKLAGNNPQLLNLFVAKQPWKMKVKDTPGENRKGPGIRGRDDYMRFEFEPNSTAYLGGNPPGYPINRWGMSDRDYNLVKSPGAYRIALIGASRAQGMGLDYADRFETLIEERLNEEQVGGVYKEYEILNFGFPGYTPGQRLMALEDKALKFKPDCVVYVAGVIDTMVDFHGYFVRRGIRMPYDYLEEINRKAGVNASMTQAEVERRLEPYGLELASGAYRRIAAVAKAQGLPAIWVHIPDPADRFQDVDAMEWAAREAGFVTVRIDDKFNPHLYQQSAVDTHPDEEGNKLIAELVYERLLRLQKAGKIDLGFSDVAVARPVSP
jgi:D-alanyl-lipoteichoic acid acyltransferase DltB (MBOAT superfamily)